MSKLTNHLKDIIAICSIRENFNRNCYDCRVSADTCKCALDKLNAIYEADKTRPSEYIDELPKDY